MERIAYYTELQIDPPQVEDYVTNPNLSLRQLMMVALLERGEPMTHDEITARLHKAEVESNTHDLGYSLKKAWKRDGAMFKDSHGRYCLDVHTDDMIYSLRRLGIKTDKETSIVLADLGKSVEKKTRAIVYCLEIKNKVVGFSLVDFDAHEVHSYLSEELHGIRDVLARFDVIVGINPRSTVESLGLDHTKWQFADLSDHQKTKRINKSGRTLKLTTEMLMSYSVGISRGLGVHEKTRSYYENGEWKKLRNRLAANAKNLYALYSYGITHNYLRLRWGFLDEDISVSWSLPQDKTIATLFQEAHENNSEIEVITNSAPSWKDPWSRGICGRVIEYEWSGITLQTKSGEPRFISIDETQAARIV